MYLLKAQYYNLRVWVKNTTVINFNKSKTRIHPTHGDLLLLATLPPIPSVYNTQSTNLVTRHRIARTLFLACCCSFRSKKKKPTSNNQSKYQRLCGLWLAGDARKKRAATPTETETENGGNKTAFMYQTEIATGICRLADRTIRGRKSGQNGDSGSPK